MAIVLYYMYNFVKLNPTHSVLNKPLREKKQNNVNIVIKYCAFLTNSFWNSETNGYNANIMAFDNSILFKIFVLYKQFDLDIVFKVTEY